MEQLSKENSQIPQLQREFLRLHARESPKLLGLRFVTAELVESMDLDVDQLSAQVLAGGKRGLEVAKVLVKRGVKCIKDGEEGEEIREIMDTAVTEGNWKLVEVILAADGGSNTRVTTWLRVSVAGGASIELLNDFVDSGAYPADIGVWKAAIKAGRRDVVEWLSEISAPPSQVLGAL
jgi:hypothetical protein